MYYSCEDKKTVTVTNSRKKGCQIAMQKYGESNQYIKKVMTIHINNIIFVAIQNMTN